MDYVSELPHSVEEHINEFIRAKREDPDLSVAFSNPLLRNEVLDLLDRYCTVLYYPIENEINNGFHVTNMPFLNGEVQNFVFINTAQTMEKQAFTAAHELGHIWNIDNYVLEKAGMDDTDDIREQIINRFAAVLLMPEEQFKETFSNEVKAYTSEGSTITVYNLLKVILVLMNKFFVPRKSVVFRLFELGIISKDTMEIFLGEKDISKEEIDRVTDKLIAEMGFTQFQKTLQKKWIEGLAEKLNFAERNNLVPQEKIDYMRSKFDLASDHTIPADMEQEFPIKPQEGLDV